jgi:hypothetical protein
MRSVHCHNSIYAYSIVSFYTSKETITRIETSLKMGEIFTSYSTDKELISRVYKELKKLKSKNNKSSN